MLQINTTEGSNIPKIEKARIPITTEDKRNKKTNLNKDFFVIIQKDEIKSTNLL